jgi:hypothetical protein
MTPKEIAVLIVKMAYRVFIVTSFEGKESPVQVPEHHNPKRPQTHPTAQVTHYSQERGQNENLGAAEK